MIKALLLPQLLYLFSVLCIKIPKYFFKELDKMFYKFIWNGGNDRVKRVYVRNHFNHCGLRMIDTYNFSLAQKMTWVKLLFDNRYDSFWKTIELSDMDHHYGDLLWNSYAPESLLNNLNSSQLADSLRTWYVYRERACQEIGESWGMANDGEWRTGQNLVEGVKVFKCFHPRMLTPSMARVNTN